MEEHGGGTDGAIGQRTWAVILVIAMAALGATALVVSADHVERDCVSWQTDRTTLTGVLHWIRMKACAEAEKNPDTGATIRCLGYTVFEYRVEGAEPAQTYEYHWEGKVKGRTGDDPFNDYWHDTDSRLLEGTQESWEFAIYSGWHDMLSGADYLEAWVGHIYLDGPASYTGYSVPDDDTYYVSCPGT